jgi:hypothetical protein
MLYKTIAEGCSWTVCRHAGPFSDQLLRIFSLRHLKIIFHLLLCWVGLHCGIYKSSYNVSNTSYLDSPSPWLCFISLSPHSWSNFNRYHFCIYIHVYRVFAPYSLSTPFPCHLRLPLILPHPTLIPQFCRGKKKKLTFLNNSYF